MPFLKIPTLQPSDLTIFLNFCDKSKDISQLENTLPRSQQLGYAIYHTLNYALWIFGIGGLLNPVFFVPLAGKLVIDALALGGFSRSLESRLTLAQLGLWEILFPVYNILAAPIAFLGSMRWKHHARSRA